MRDENKPNVSINTRMWTSQLLYLKIRDQVESKKKSSQTLLGSDTLKTNGQRKVEIKEMVKRHNKQNSNRKNAVTPIIISDKIWKC